MSNSGITSFKFHDFTYTWIIEDFDTNYKNYNEIGISSPVFIADNINEKHNLQLQFYGFGFSKVRLVYNYVGPISPLTDKSKKVSTTFCFLIVQDEFLKKEKLHNITDRTVFEFSVDSYPNFLYQRNLTIRFKIRFYHGFSHVTPKNSSPFSMPRSSILDDLKKLLFSENLTDVKLIVNKEIFQVHKSILAARSPVFSVMFQTDMREKKENIVEIDDIKPEVMKEMLNFIYTDKVNSDLVQITDLLAAADKYQIEGLRIICLEAIVSGLSVDNVVEVIALTDRYEIPELEDYTINFLAFNRANIIAKKNWDKVMKSMPPRMLMKLTTMLMQQK